MSKTRHFNLKKKWFDMILSGEKKEEYRDLKPYWINRLTSVNKTEIQSSEDVIFNQCDTITFSNGYAKDRRRFVIEVKKIRIGFGKLDWGA